jgi:hypothetical protein
MDLFLIMMMGNAICIKINVLYFFLELIIWGFMDGEMMMGNRDSF